MSMQQKSSIRRSDQAREVAEILINSSITSDYPSSAFPRYQQTPNSSMVTGSLHNSLLNDGDYLHEAVIAGSTTNGRMSAVRRFFCLFVTFDLMFTTLLWIICFVITGENIQDVLYQQVVEYSIHTSLFDVVMAAACRFIILILFYALLRINHWFIIALTTSGSCAFLVAKVFQYKWASTSYTLEVFLILSSFIISWGQAWFLDFRVVPQELQARDFLRAIANDDERQPLIGQGRQTNSYRSGADTADFYSPIDSPQESDDEQVSDRTRHHRNRLSREDEEYIRKGLECFEESWATINSDGWKEEKKTAEGDVVHSKFIHRTHKIFRITGTVEIPPHLLYEELHHNIENVPSWNPTLIECRSLKVIDDKTSISYHVAAEGAGGIVSSRDFVNLRYCDVRDGIFICSGISIPFADMPPQKGHVRGENGPGCWVMHPIPNEPNKCIFQWLLDTNLKGWIPQSIIDSALSFAMCDYIRYIRNFGTTLRNQGKF